MTGKGLSSVFIILAALGEVSYADTFIVIQTAQDGVYLLTSPLRLNTNDFPIGLGVMAALGRGFALDRIARKNLSAEQNDSGAKDLRHYGDVGNFPGSFSARGSL